MPNTTIVFDSTDVSQSGIDTSMCELIVEGSLRVLGTKSDSITFMPMDISALPPLMTSLDEGLAKGSNHSNLTLEASADGGSENPVLSSEWDTTAVWYGIRVLPEGSAKLGYAKIADANSGITLNNSAYDTISNCYLFNNRVGVDCSNSNAFIYKNRIRYNPIGYTAIYLNQVCNPLSLKDNTLENYKYHIYATNCSTTIEGNTILGCDYGNVIGIHCTNSKYFNIKSTHIARRRFLECYIKADSSTIHIHNCLLEGTWWQMTPIGILTTDCDGSIRKTKITNYADTGIVAHVHGVMPRCLDLGTEADWGNNWIFSDSSSIAVNNATQVVMMAQRNWWGTRNPQPSFFIGDVEYIPYLLSEAVTAIPEEFQLLQNYPNPFNPETRIIYSLPKDCKVKLDIYNILGQKVKTLVDRLEAAGHKSVTWDGTNEQGDRVASGVFFYRLEAGEFTATKKMVIIR
jgi:hypothetical protein